MNDYEFLFTIPGTPEDEQKTVGDAQISTTKLYDRRGYNPEGTRHPSVYIE